MNHLTARRIDLARPVEADAWLSLLDAYACDPMGGGHPLSEAVRRRLLLDLAHRPGFCSWLAWHDGRAVGLLNAFEGYSTFAARPLLNIHDLYVTPEQRGRGAVQQLLSAAETEARARGACKLTLEVLANNTRALSAYRRAGFAPYQLDPQAGDAQFLQKLL